jgi:hypothetical protein
MRTHEHLVPPHQIQSPGLPSARNVCTLLFRKRTAGAPTLQMRTYATLWIPVAGNQKTILGVSVSSTLGESSVTIFVCTFLKLCAAVRVSEYAHLFFPVRIISQHQDTGVSASFILKFQVLHLIPHSYRKLGIDSVEQEKAAYPSDHINNKYIRLQVVCLL